MRRIVVRLMVSLMVGVVVTVLVAWYRPIEMSAAMVNGYPDLDIVSISGTPWPIEVPNDWPAVPTSQRSERSLFRSSHYYYGFGELEAPFSAIGYELPDVFVVIAEVSGWPLRASVRFERIDGRSMRSGHHELGVIRGGLPLPASWRSVKLGTTMPLPIMPLWPGFLVNALFYSALIFGTLAGLSHLKRQRRLRRGLCVQCAYPVAELNRCPECGELPLSQPPRV